MRDDRAASGGFTLLEVVVAVAILGAAAAVLLGSVNRNLELAFHSKNLLVATALAQKRMAEIELDDALETGEWEGTFDEAPSFAWHLTVEPFVVGGLDTEMLLVRLVVTWDEGNRSLEVTYAR